MSRPDALRLHGYPVSNYYNAARAALIEKGVLFELVSERAGQEEAFLARSAMGKIPYLETPQGCIAETVAILDYLEEAAGGVPLLPSDPFARAKVRQVINIVQLYVEAPLRTLFPGVFMGGTNSEQAVAAARPVLDRAMRAVGHLVTPRPFLMGEALTTADLFSFYTFDIGERVAGFTWDMSLLDQVEGLRDWFDAMADRPSSRAVLSDFDTAFAAYLRDKAAAWQEPELKETHHA
jgi:glutathione S-transferase